MTAYGKLAPPTTEIAAAQTAEAASDVAKAKRQAVLQRIRNQRAHVLKNAVRKQLNLEEMSRREIASKNQLAGGQLMELIRHTSRRKNR